MLGLGLGATEGGVVDAGEALFQLVSSGGFSTGSSDDENVKLLMPLGTTSKTFVGMDGINNNAIIPGLTASVTITHKSKDTGSGLEAIDPVETSTGTLNCYDNGGFIILSQASSSTVASNFALDFTASPFSGVDAVGDNNQYSVTVNSLSFSGAISPAARTTGNFNVDAK